MRAHAEEAVMLHMCCDVYMAQRIHRMPVHIDKGIMLHMSHDVYLHMHLQYMHKHRTPAKAQAVVTLHVS